MNRQDIKTMIDDLRWLKNTSDGSDYVKEDRITASAIYMLEELGDIVHDLRLDNESLKQEILQLEAMIDD